MSDQYNHCGMCQNYIPSGESCGDCKMRLHSPQRIVADNQIACELFKPIGGVHG